MSFPIPDNVRNGPPADRALNADRLYTEVTELSGEVARLRREAIEEMLSAGSTKAEVARLLGKHPTRVGRIVSSSPAPERALLSPDGAPVTVALGSKVSEVGGKPSDMISRDAAEAYDALRTAIDGYGLVCSREVVPAPGLVDLNRPNLVVMGSPKVLPIIGQILASDPHLGFAEDDQGRHLVDYTTGTKYHSPQDNGESADYAYIGRLNRPDGQGTFLYLAGIHAAGTHGAVRWLVENLPDLYREARNKPFSLLTWATYDDKDRERSITETGTLTTTHLR